MLNAYNWRFELYNTFLEKGIWILWWIIHVFLEDLLKDPIAIYSAYAFWYGFPELDSFLNNIVLFGRHLLSEVFLYLMAADQFWMEFWFALLLKDNIRIHTWKSYDLLKAAGTAEIAVRRGKSGAAAS